MESFSEEKKRLILNRLAKASGHLEAVRRMFADGRDCTEVMIQLNAVRSAIGSTEKMILKEYLGSCVDEVIDTGDEGVREHLYDTIDRFVR